MSKWEKKALVEVVCDKCSRERKQSQLLAQVVRRPNGLRWRSAGIRRLPAPQRRSGVGRDETRDIDMEMPEDLTADGCAEFFAVVCWRHGTMFAPLDEIEQGTKTTPTTTVRVSPDAHRYSGDR
jgi:hypothetical protein